MDAIKKLDRSVKGRGVLITGAASGMGRATAHLFAQEGALVAVTDVNDAGVARVVEEIRAEGGKAEGWRLDVCDAAEIKRVVAEVAKSFGRLDIVNIASTEGLGATPGDSPYVVAKTAVIGLTRALAVDLGPEGITVNCICPGPIRTALTDAIPEEHKTILAKRRTALKRYGYPEEVAHITFSLCLPAASYLTGAIIPVDGVLTIRNA